MKLINCHLMAMKLINCHLMAVPLGMDWIIQGANLEFQSEDNNGQADDGISWIIN